MTPTDITILRLINQQIIESKCKSVKDIVGWMGAMQAQDFNMAKWAIGLRLPGSTDKLIEAAVDSVEIIRTHILRPTWHFVSASDIYWMLELSAPQIKSVAKSRDRELGITEAIFQKSNALLETVLSGNKQLSREELVTEYRRANIATEDNRFYHLLMRAEIDGIIFSRNSGSNKQSYSLLCENVRKTTTYTRDEALANLAKKYFSSHGPATIQDFSWWSGLSISDSKRALEMSLPNFISETIENQTFWFSPSSAAPKFEKDLVFLLPAFDEFLISYKDRTASLPFEINKKAVSNNGIFRPVIVHNGQVIGIWRRTIKKDKIFLEMDIFQYKHNRIKDMILKAAIPFGDFLQKQVEMNC